MNRLFLSGLLLTLQFTSAHAQHSNQSEAQLRQELNQLRQQFFDAQKQGNRAVLEQLVADSFYFVHSTGVVERKKEYIDRTVAQAARAPQIEFLEQQLFIYGDNTAIWLTRSVTRANGIENNFRGTDVLVRNGDHWQWASVNSTKLPTRPQPVAVALDTLKSYVGEYRINPDRKLIVSESNGALIAQAPGLRQKDLIPKSSTEFVWFNPDSNADLHIVFVRDANGQVTHAVLISEGKEAWRAKKL